MSLTTRRWSYKSNFSATYFILAIKSAIMMRENVIPPMQEIKEILIADVALTVAMSFFLLHLVIFPKNSGIVSDFIMILPAAAVAVVLSFVIHELMHKFVAQKYGAIAAFRVSFIGLAIALATSIFGFLFAAPGATVIYTSNFTKRQNGLVSLAGPLTNFVVFLCALFILYAVNPAATSYLYLSLSIILLISIVLAFFNMLPIFPLDGSKVLAWNRPVYFSTLAAVFVLMLFSGIPLFDIVIMVIIALFFSLFYRNMFRY